MPYSNHNISIWLGRIQDAQRTQQRHHPRWREAQEFVDGTWLGRLMAHDPDATAVNYAWAYVHTVRAAIYARNPYTFVEARHVGFREFAHSMEKVLNYLKRELGLKKQIKQATTEAQITGLSWIETGFTADFGTLDLRPGSADEALLRKAMGDGQHPESQGVLNEYIRDISAYAIRRSAYNVLQAPGYPDVSVMPYLIVGEDFAPEDFANHPLYKRLRVDVRPTQRRRPDAGIVSTPQEPTAIIPMSSGSVRPGGFGRIDEQDFLRVWHVWDRRHHERGEFFEGNAQASLGPFGWPSCLEGFQHVPLIFNWLPETERITNAYPIGDITPMASLLRELHLLRTAMVKHRKRSGTLIILPEALASSENLAALKTGDDVSIVTLKGMTAQNQVVNHSPPALPPDLYRIDERILQDLDLVGRFSQVFLAAAPKRGGRTATEVRAEAQGTAFGTQEKIDIIEEFSVEVDRRLAALVWEHYPREKVRRILGESILTESLWPSLPEDMEERCQLVSEELQYTIQAGSTQPLKDKTLKNEMRLRFAKVVGAVAPDLLKRGELIRQLAEDMEFEDAKAFVILEDAQEQRHIDTENRLLLQGIPQAVGPNEPHQMHVAGHQQALQQQGGKSTPAMDQHLMAHGQELRAKLPQQSPHGMSPMSEREEPGIPDETDMVGALSRALTEPGTEQGETPSLER